MRVGVADICILGEAILFDTEVFFRKEFLKGHL